MSPAGKVLVIGYGNPGRLDDGLGPALAEELEKRRLPGVTVDSDYQLTVEDAAAAAECDVVVFADASTRGRGPFRMRAVRPGRELSFSSHSCSPEAVLALARELFGKAPAGYVLAIRGYDFNEFGQVLSDRARANLSAALRHLEALLRDESFRTGAAGPERVSGGRPQ